MTKIGQLCEENVNNCNANNMKLLNWRTLLKEKS